jgi:YfiH family protein
MNSVPFFTSEVLSNISKIKHGFFTRQGGVSSNYFSSLNTGNNKGDLIANTHENRKRICQTLGFDIKNLILVLQQHTNQAIYVDRPFEVDKMPTVDAMVTDVSGVLLGVQTADCVPILLSSQKKPVIAAIHAGWRGAVSGIITNTINKMKLIGKVDANDIRAAIGPCIWQLSYEVGPEFKKILGTENNYLIPSAKENHFMFDLPSFVVNALKQNGIKHISRSPYDTFSNGDKFFSYRRSTLKKDPHFGVQMSCIGLT